MLQPLADPEKGQGDPRPQHGGDVSHSSGQALARPSPTWGGERVPARPLSAVQLQVELCTRAYESRQKLNRH
eukprot:3898588-Amphidinium_carterae.1